MQTIILSTNNPILSSKLNDLSHNSIASGQNLKFIHKQGSFFPDDHFEFKHPFIIFEIECFVP